MAFDYVFEEKSEELGGRRFDLRSRKEEVAFFLFSWMENKRRKRTERKEELKLLEGLFSRRRDVSNNRFEDIPSFSFSPFFIFPRDLFTRERVARERKTLKGYLFFFLFIAKLMERMHSLNSHFRGKRRGTGGSRRESKPSV